MQLGADEEYRIKNAIKYGFTRCFRYKTNTCSALNITDPLCEKIKAEAKKQGVFKNVYIRIFPCPCDHVDRKDIYNIVTTYLKEGRT